MMPNAYSRRELLAADQMVPRQTAEGRQPVGQELMGQLVMGAPVMGGAVAALSPVARGDATLRKADTKAVSAMPSRVARGLAALRRGTVLAAVLGAVALAPAASVAQEASEERADYPVVLELYTAQGCASCPPADDMMLELAARDDVIALALHVDYWDYIGWADSFADPEHAQRQQRYARRHGHSTIYTPQVVINGIEIVEGFRVMQVMEIIGEQLRRRPDIDMQLARIPGDRLQIEARPYDHVAPVLGMASRRQAMPNAVVGTLSMGDAAASPEAAVPAAPPSDAIGDDIYSVQMVRYRPFDEVEILSGENAGLQARYANIVIDWQLVTTWDLSSPLEVTVPLAGDDPVVVIVQESGQGEIIAATRLR